MTQEEIDFIFLTWIYKAKEWYEENSKNRLIYGMCKAFNMALDENLFLHVNVAEVRKYKGLKVITNRNRAYIDDKLWAMELIPEFNPETLHANKYSVGDSPRYNYWWPVTNTWVRVKAFEYLLRVYKEKVGLNLDNMEDLQKGEPIFNFSND